MAPSLPVQKTGNIRGCQVDMFLSCELTGDGCAMSTAHGLGHTPTKTWAILTDFAAAAVPDIVQGAPTSTNVVYTVTACVKYRAYAF